MCVALANSNVGTVLKFKFYCRYGFEYEFVTYKWPHWLHKQTDKQRIIWAYKILFLDVLFPLDVPRMIFVDSDQVVRTDLAELYNMDIKVCCVGVWCILWAVSSNQSLVYTL